MKKKIELITPTEYAEIHGLNPQTVRKWARLGRIDGVEKYPLPAEGQHYYLVPKDAKPPVLKAGRPKKEKTKAKK